MERPQSSMSIRKSNIVKRAANITFKADIDPKLINQILAKHKDLFKSAQWTFCFKDYQKNNINKLLETADIVLIERLVFHFCRNTVLKDIKSISFPRLKVLDLSGNKIVSLQRLQTCNLVLLERLFLRKNQLTSLKSLRKCNFKLKLLQVSQNSIPCFDSLWGEVDFSNLTNISTYQNCAVLNLNILRAQMKFENVDYFWGQSQNNIDTRLLRRKMTQMGIGSTVLRL